MANTYLTKQISNAGTNRTKATISLWVQIGASIGNDQRFFSYENTSVSNNVTVFKFVGLAGGSMGIQFADQTGGSNNARFDGTRALRDPSAWYHFVVKADTTQLTNTDRLKIYINGELQTSTHGSYTYPSQNSTLNFGHNSNAYIDIGRWRGSNSQYFDGSITHFHYTDGYAYDASTFGSADSTTGEWKINTSPSITMGTNGFTILKDGNTITDQSTNSNDFSLGGGTLTKTFNNPSNVFATLNPLARNHGDQDSSLTQGNNTYEITSYEYNTKSTLGMTKGKFYWEQLVSTNSSVRIGLCTSQFNSKLDTDNAEAYYGGSTGYGGVYVLLSSTTANWQRTNNDATRNIDTYTYGIGSGNSSILMGAVDVDAGKLWIGVDGVWMHSGNPATGSNAQITFTNSSGDALHVYAGNGTSANRINKYNFGNGTFGTTLVTTNSGNGYSGAEGSSKFNFQPPANFAAISTKGLNL